MSDRKIDQIQKGSTLYDIEDKRVAAIKTTVDALPDNYAGKTAFETVKTTVDNIPSTYATKTALNTLSTTVSNLKYNDVDAQIETIINTTEPTTSTVGIVSQHYLYLDSVNNKYKDYVCTKVEDGVYTWETMVGSVTKVCNVSPDVNGNVTLTAANVGADTSGAAASALTSAKTYTDEKVATKQDTLNSYIRSISTSGNTLTYYDKNNNASTYTPTIFHVGTTAPTNTSILWVDPSNGLKYYNGTN